jgi:hypothetical protein
VDTGNQVGGGGPQLLRGRAHVARPGQPGALLRGIDLPGMVLSGVGVPGVDGYQATPNKGSATGTEICPGVIGNYPVHVYATKVDTGICTYMPEGRRTSKWKHPYSSARTCTSTTSGSLNASSKAASKPAVASTGISRRRPPAIWPRAL